MAYENGVRINRYKNKIRHKTKQKNQHIACWSFGADTGLDFDVFCEKYAKKYGERPYVASTHAKYWQMYHASSRRRTAHNLMTGTIRSKNALLRTINGELAEDIYESDFDQFDLTRQIEKKTFEYAWYLW